MPIQLTVALLICWGLISTVACYWIWLALAASRRTQREIEKTSLVLAQEREVLELIAGGASLSQILDTLTLTIERFAPGSLCTVLLLDETGTRLSAGSSGSLPKDYLQAINGKEIGPERGACGTAAYYNQTVIVEDVATDPKFAPAKDFVLSYGLRACWSVPVRDSQKNVLGTFAMYHRRTAKPKEWELRLLEAGAHLAGNAIERLRAQEKLQQHAERIALAEKAAAFGIWETNEKSIKFSDGFAALLGLTDGRRELPLDLWFSWIHPEDIDSLHEAAARCTLHGEAFLGDARMLLPDGTTRWHRLHGHCEPGQVQGNRVVGATVDITREKEMMARLDQARAAAEAAMHAKTDFLANMSHEIRTPINGIITSIELLLDSPMTEEQREYVETVRCCGETLLRLINDILDLTKMEAGKLTLEQTSFQPIRLAKEVIAVIAPLARARGLEARLRFDPDIPSVLIGDPQRLSQVLLNLLSNAVKFTESGSVTLDASVLSRTKDSAELCLRVVDTGIGIPPQVQQTIFEPFTQADTSTTRRYGGTGLGLTISRRLIALMHGQLELESEPGRGSTFKVIARFPVGDHSALPAQSSRSIPVSTRPLRILLTEDNPINQKLTTRVLERMGHSVSLAGDGSQAIAAFHSSEFDVILMDCQMPGTDGYAATQAIRQSERGRAVPIIALTAHSMQEEVLRCRKAGMDDYLSKPVSAERLYAMLESVADRITSRRSFAESIR
ncbi:MAG: response regulator [Acidobacteriia bacterium]|nr:response regulator [Terriglobia bacterium]